MNQSSVWMMTATTAGRGLRRKVKTGMYHIELYSPCSLYLKLSYSIPQHKYQFSILLKDNEKCARTMLYESVI